ncbi:hypothetical protein BOTBODRAFT_190536 [Botryobasidium botryosum FD-172 SS1]|uniref:Uncharacterized protein n=1 Tax=Botryobasidium botryosum (strain FD-172 SS1) TaxID=930990 RepID=A0A067M6S8_BOTB1|nr:hypothetical protein BOTBODRAFT_190536 [Botryobasidium botryosum FD-172 SS1]
MDEEHSKPNQTPPDNSHDAHPRKRHWFQYTLACSLALVIIICTWTFRQLAAISPGIPAWPSFGKFARDNTRSTIMGVTVFCTFLNFLAKWLFYHSVVIFTRLRLMEERTFVETAFLGAVASGRAFRTIHGGGAYTATSVVILGLLGLLTAGFTSLFTPLPIPNTIGISGSELDFASTSPECIDWYMANSNPEDCRWMSYSGFTHSTCLAGNQALYVLLAGRAAMYGHYNNITQDASDDAAAYIHLNSAWLYGSTSGVLPSGPYGIPKLDSMNAFYVPDSYIRMGSMSWNYTTNLQGLTADVQCQYADQSPIQGTPQPGSYGGTCPGASSASPNITYPPSPSTMTVMACPSVNSSGPTDSATMPYNIYLRAFGSDPAYQATLGNITCRVAPRLVEARTSFRTDLSAFITSPEPTPLSATFNIASQAIEGIVAVIQQTQTIGSNMVFQSVVTFAVNYFGSDGVTRNESYPMLFETFIRGMIEYEASYIRFNLTAAAVAAPPPLSCTRNYTGGLTYQSYGWDAELSPAALLPLTTLVAIAFALVFTTFYSHFMLHSTRHLPAFDPTNFVSITVAVAAGGFKLPESIKTAADEDNILLGTKVRYGKLEDGSKEGLISKLDEPS